MVKNLILIGVLGVFIGFVFYVRIQLEEDRTWIEKKSKEIEINLDKKEAQLIYEELDAYWEARVSWWGMILPHDNLQDVSKEIKKLGVAVELGNKEDAAMSIVLLNLTMNHLLDRNTLRMDHIF